MSMTPGIITRRLDFHVCELPKTSNSNLPKLPPNAKFYSRWKRNFQKLILVSEKHPLTRLHLRSHAAIAFEKRRHGRSPFWWVIHPCSNFRFFWDCLMTLVLLYIFVMVPYILMFHRIAKSAGPEYWNWLYPAYVICIIDIALNFITGFLSLDGHEIYIDPGLTIRHYLKRFFLVDLISSIPYVWFYPISIAPPGPTSNSIFLIAELLPVLKILRIYTLRKYIRQINMTFMISHAFEMTIWLGILTVLIFHWSSCITHGFPYIVMHVKGDSMELHTPRITDLEENLTALPTLLQHNFNLLQQSGVHEIENKLQVKPNWEIYLIYLHIGVSNLVGSSFIELESFGILDKAIRCILLLLGKAYMIYLLVINLQLVESSAEPELKYQRIMHQVKEYIHEKKLPELLKNKLIAYYEYRFQGSYFKENAISATLSNHLNQEITIHSCRGLLDKATILHNLPRNVIGNLMGTPICYNAIIPVGVLRPVIYLEDDIIYKCDTEGDCMYFIASGTVALVTFHGKEVCHAEDGGYFGEAALIFSDRTRLESVIALEVCELLRFDRRYFKRMFTLQSEFYRRLEKVAQERSDKIKELNDAYLRSQTEQADDGAASATTPADVTTDEKIQDNADLDKDTEKTDNHEDDEDDNSDE